MNKVIQTVAALAACVDAGICKVASQETFDLLVSDFLEREQDPSLEKVADYLLELPFEAEKHATESIEKVAFLLPGGSKILKNTVNMDNLAALFNLPQGGLSAYTPQIKGLAKSILPGMAVGGIAGGYMGNESFKNNQSTNYAQQQPTY